MKNSHKASQQSGFTLVEMAVVLVIFAALLGGLILPLTAQQDLKNIEATRNSLKAIHEALLGFVVLNGRLPCPSTQADPTHADYGLEDSDCSANYPAEGYLPWRSLGVIETDEWGNRRTSAADNWNGYWRYRIDRNYTTVALFSTNIIATTPTWGDSLAIQDNAGNTISSATERPIAIIYSSGKDMTPNGQNASFEAANGIYESNSNTANFDDIVVWITRPALLNRITAAGKLP